MVAGEQETPAGEPEPPSQKRFRIGGEVKVHFRDSQAEELRLNFPFPPDFIPPGQAAVFARTVAEGKSFELSTATLIAEGELGGGVAAKVEVHFSDLYNRNPTSSDDRVFVRQALGAAGRQVRIAAGAAGDARSTYWSGWPPASPSSSRGGSRATGCGAPRSAASSSRSSRRAAASASTSTGAA